MPTPAPHPVALVGFSAFERDALTTLLRAETRRTRVYTPVDDAAAAPLVIADGENPRAVAALREAGRLAATVFVGTQAPAGSLGRVGRPVDFMALLRALDAGAQRPPRAPADAPAADEGPRRRRSDHGRGGRKPTPPATALVVDDSEIAARYLALRLAALGLQVSCAHSSDAALAEMAARPYRFVFLDVELGPGSALDGLMLAQHIRREPPAGHEQPVIAFVTAHAGAADQVRGALAGGDEYLGKPLDAQALRSILVKHGHVPASRAEDHTAP